MGALVFCALIGGNECNTRRCLGFDAVPCQGDGTVVEGGTQVVHGIARQTLRHRRDDNMPVTFSEHAGFSDGLAVLQRGTQIYAA
ncbi:MAG: Uncharacterised protein [Halieaceae bacterium]|nr:MAG: Uncharacterised protein [Halieaceae bacterium]